MNKDFYGNSNTFLLTKDGDIFKIPSRHSYLKHTICLLVGHYFGVDEVGFARACARCGLLQFSNYGKGFVSLEKWRKLNGVKNE